MLLHLMGGFVIIMRYIFVDFECLICHSIYELLWPYYKLRWDPRLTHRGVHVIIEVGSANEQLMKIYDILWQKS